MHCTQCGTPGDGRFCSACGASLEDLSCSGCRARVGRGSRFCTACGAALNRPAATAPPEGDGGARVGWTVAGILLVGLLAVAAFPIFSSGSGTSDGGAAPSPALGPAPDVDLSAMTPRQAADRLFNRVAMALENQDAAEVRSFLPMAMDAYELARPLDTDGLFHLAFLQRVALDPEASLSTAREGLALDPDHLLHLAAAAEALVELGRGEEAREYYGRILQVWDRESVRELEDYREHAGLLPMIRTEAETFMAER